MNGRASGKLTIRVISVDPTVTLWIELRTRAVGEYTGAALVQGESSPQFQTLSGRWRIIDEALDLGDQEPVPLRAAPGFLQLEIEVGRLALRRSLLE